MQDLISTMVRKPSGAERDDVRPAPVGEGEFRDRRHARAARTGGARRAGCRRRPATGGDRAAGRGALAERSSRAMGIRFKASGSAIAGRLARSAMSRSAAPVGDHHGGALLGDHDRRRVGIAGGDARHRGGVDDAQAARRRGPAGARRARPSGSPRVPIFAVPTGWKIVVPMSPAAAISSSSRREARAPGRCSCGR